jgi:MSHA biogenesis protein MshI
MKRLRSSRLRGKGRLAFAWHDGNLCWVHADASRVSACGIEARADGDDDAGFARRVRGLGLPDALATAVLPLAACQLLQIEAPAVPAEELKAAARWAIKERIEGRLDDLTIDVMHVGDGRAKSRGQLYVAAAATREVRAVSQWSEAARLALDVIDIRETAQRNMQTAAMRARGQVERASALLVVHGATALLTIAAGGELFHARRLEWNPRWLDAPSAFAGEADAQDPIADYADLDIVDYGAGDADAPGAQGEVAPIVLEMQRSLDVWDRSWPDLPLDRLLVHAQDHTAALAALLGVTLPLPVEALDVDALFPGLEQACASPRVRHAVVPLLGALLRD